MSGRVPRIRGLVITGFGGHGVVVNGSDGNLIESNTIFGNGGDGVRVLAGVANGILSNAIYDNGGLGIDLGGDGSDAKRYRRPR